MCREFKNKFVTRFLSIGFSQNHDAKFMNEIAQSGSTIGNFIFIDSNKPNFENDVDSSLSESLDIAMEGDSGLKIIVRSDADKEWKQDLMLNPTPIISEEESKDGEFTVTGYELNNQSVMSTVMV